MKPDDSTSCKQHPDAEVVECRADGCSGRWLCLSHEPHHLDEDHSPTASWRHYTRMVAKQFEAWFEIFNGLPPPLAIQCPACRHGCYVRWRSGRDAIKASCEACGLELDVAARDAWRAPRGPWGQEWVVGDYVRVVGGIWMDINAPFRTGIVAAIHRNKAYLDHIRVYPVVTVEYLDSGRPRRQDWYPDQLESVSHLQCEGPDAMHRGPHRQHWRIGDRVHAIAAGPGKLSKPMPGRVVNVQPSDSWDGAIVSVALDDPLPGFNQIDQFLPESLIAEPRQQAGTA